MKKQSENEKKELANQLSKSISQNKVGDDEIRCIMEKLSGINKKEVQETQKQEDLFVEKTVGIWKLGWDNGNKVYLRDDQFANEFVYWADVPRIEPKSEKFRIVLLGESVARGWPVDPGYNPAISLNKIFDKAGSNVEIIDLARTNCGLSDLRKLLYECVELKPDALVIFGGNNWIINCQKLFTDDHELIEIAIDQIDQGNYEALKSSIQEIVSREAEEFFSLLNQISRAQNLLTFIVNPEFNLQDWRSNDLEKLPLFDADMMSEWYQTCSDTLDALKNGDLKRAGSLSDKLIGLFPSNPYGYELKAECSLLNGDTNDARKYLRDAIENKMYQTSSPGITATLQEQIRTMCRQYNFQLIDLPSVFQQHLENGIPGREIFLDYCHMTVRGINIAMYHLASQFSSVVFGTEMSLSLDDVIGFGHDNVNDAKSHFLAAIHNAHWGQDFEIICYHCRKALSYYNISDYMLAFAKAMNSTCPGRLNKDFGFLVESGIFSTYILLTLQSDGTEAFNVPLYNAILKSLDEQGINERDRLTNFRNAEHCRGVKKVNLLKACYHNGYRYNLSSKLKDTAYYREYYKSSHFIIMADQEGKIINLEIVHRFPYKTSGCIEFELNGMRIGNAASGNNWSKSTINLPVDMIHMGMNAFVIHWPVSCVANKLSDIAMQAINAPEPETLYQKMYRSTGEIHSLELSYENEEEQLPARDEVTAQLFWS
jgi:hypothetical protein